MSAPRMWRLRIFAELNDGDVLAESVSFVCTVVCSGAFITNRIDLIAHIQSIEIETKWWKDNCIKKFIPIYQLVIDGFVYIFREESTNSEWWIIINTNKMCITWKRKQ